MPTLSLHSFHSLRSLELDTSGVSCKCQSCTPESWTNYRTGNPNESRVLHHCGSVVCDDHGELCHAPSLVQDIVIHMGPNLGTPKRSPRARDSISELQAASVDMGVLSTNSSLDECFDQGCCFSPADAFLGLDDGEDLVNPAPALFLSPPIQQPSWCLPSVVSTAEPLVVCSSQ